MCTFELVLLRVWQQPTGEGCVAVPPCVNRYLHIGPLFVGVNVSKIDNGELVKYGDNCKKKISSRNSQAVDFSASTHQVSMAVLFLLQLCLWRICGPNLPVTD